MSVRIIRYTDHTLVIYSPANMSRFFAIALLVVGGLLIALSAGLGLASLGVPVLRAPVGTSADKFGGTLFLVATGLFFALPGIWILRRARDRTFEFVAKERELRVRSKLGTQTFPFARIVRAELTEAPDEGSTVYGLGIVLRDPDETLHVTDGYTPEQSHKRTLAEAINGFLARCGVTA